MCTGFFLCSNKSFCLFLCLPLGKCNIGCDTSTGLSAGQRPASIQPHHNTSILRRDTLSTFCAQRSRISLHCGPLRSDDSYADVNTEIFVYKLWGQTALKACLARWLLSMHKTKLCVCVCHQDLVIRSDGHSSVKCCVLLQQTGGFSSHWCTILDLS